MRSPRRAGNVAYFETTPVNPTDTNTVSFDAGFARAADGTTDGLTYYWDFGDGTHATGKTVSHTYSGALWADVKLVVAKGSDTIQVGRVPAGPRGAQPVGRGAVDARLRHVLPAGARRSDQRRHEQRHRRKGGLTVLSKFRSAARTALHPRWLALAAVLAAGSTAVIVSSGGAKADAPPASNPAHPVVDASWIYANDWYNATHFIYKRAGSDGCLPGATSCAFGTPGDANNLPQNYNGTQEFNKWWGDLGTTSTPQPMGVLGKWMSKRDHLFPQANWQINTQELTIPGATCPGQQVMLAFHPDSQQVSRARTRPTSNQPHAVQQHVLGRLGNRLTVRLQHGRDHELGGDRLGSPLA